MMLFRWNGLVGLLTDACCGSGIVCGAHRANDEEMRLRRASFAVYSHDLPSSPVGMIWHPLPKNIHSRHIIAYKITTYKTTCS